MPAKIEIDPEQVRKLAAIGCTNIEIASVVGCSKDTIERRFAAEIADGRLQGKAKLRRLQWQAAERGHWPALEFLGRQLLGQTNNPPIDEGDGFEFSFAKKD